MQLITVIIFVLVVIADAKNQESIRKSKATRIINGAEAVPHSIPWQAHLEFVDAEDMASMCGGSLINKQWILTAAHCIQTSIFCEVLLGAHDLLELEGSTLIRSEEFILHEDYDSVTLNNDIALIKLPKPIEFNEYIQPISVNTEDNVDDMEATMSGWGQQSEKMSSLSSILRSVDVRVMPGSKCITARPNKKSKICTKSGAKDVVKSTCFGDSGGPLVVNMKSQIGIASALAQGCESGFPNVFTRVSYYIDWINDKIA